MDDGLPFGAVRPFAVFRVRRFALFGHWSEFRLSNRNGSIVDVANEIPASLNDNVNVNESEADRCPGHLQH